MVLAEAPRLYPVFTHHAKELQAASRYLVRRMEQYAAGNREPDEKFNALLDRYRQVVGTFQLMRKAKDPFVYLNQEERDLVQRVNTWLKDNPNHRIA